MSSVVDGIFVMPAVHVGFGASDQPRSAKRCDAELSLNYFDFILSARREK